MRYVLEGSVRRAGDKVRITGQLIESLKRGCIFGLIDTTVSWKTSLKCRIKSPQGVVGQLVAHVEFAEAERAKRKPTANGLDAYDCYLRGRANIWKWSKASTEQVLELISLGRSN